MTRQKEIKLKRHDLVFAVVVVFLLGAIAGISFLPKPVEQKKQSQSALSDYSVEIGIPAVDAQGRGVVGTLYTTVRSGTGKILVNVDNVFSEVDTQFSSRTAVKAAADYMKVDPSTIDVIFNLKVNASIVEGPSAGSSMATSVAMALGGIKPDNRVMMTGTIEENGTIGQVGAVAEKAKAAKEAGAKIFIVPYGQSTGATSIMKKNCQNYGSVNICTINYVKDNTDISRDLGIRLVEAKNLGDALGIYRNLTQTV